MKLGLISAAALLTLLPCAALARGDGESKTYTAIYSPALDVVTRSCEITRRTVGQGDGQTTLDDNTSVMRTIGQGAGNAVAKAGINFQMVGPNIVAIESASMSAVDVSRPNRSGDGIAANTNGSIELIVPNAKVKLLGQTDGKRFGFNPHNGGQSSISKVTFENGQLVQGLGGDNKLGSIIVGSRLNARGMNQKELENSRAAGSRSGTVNFKLTGIEANTPTTVMTALISCEPLPVVRERDGLTSEQKEGLITAIRNNNNE